MKTKTLIRPMEEISYPVGLNMSYNLSIIKSMATYIRELGKKDIILCCSGSSGAIIASVIYTEIPDLIEDIWHIKKTGETAHRSGVGYGCHENNYSIIVDDFALTGKTVNYINSEYKNLTERDIDCVCLSAVASNAELDFNPKLIIKGRL